MMRALRERAGGRRGQVAVRAEVADCPRGVGPCFEVRREVLGVPCEEPDRELLNARDGGHLSLKVSCQLRLVRRDQPTAVDLTELIVTRPGVRSGKPCFIGTRIAVYEVLTIWLRE